MTKNPFRQLSEHESDGFQFHPLSWYDDCLQLWVLSIFLVLGVSFLEQWVENWEQFDREFVELQNPSNSLGRSLYAFVRRELCRFKLAGDYTEAYILNEAYIRGIEQIAKGKLIWCPRAWIRTTAYNIIRESRRQQRVFAPFEEECYADQTTDVDPEPLHEKLVMLRMAFQTLDPATQCLLNLRVQGHTWTKVRKRFSQEGYGDHAEATLRKRYERAIIKLRKRFHAIAPML